MRTKKDVLKAFDEGYPKFKWFLEKYESFFPDEIPLLEAAREREDVQYILNTLNNIWYYLPDSVFNIKVKPPGWFEFLNVIEE